MFIGDGAKMVRDAFALAKEKSPAIIFIDELDAIGTKVSLLAYNNCSLIYPHLLLASGPWRPSQRFASEKEGDREVQRTMLELLNQLDGFSSTSDIKVHTRTYKHTHAHTHTHTHACTHTHARTHARTHACTKHNKQLTVIVMHTPGYSGNQQSGYPRSCPAQIWWVLTPVASHASIQSPSQ